MADVFSGPSFIFSISPSFSTTGPSEVSAYPKLAGRNFMALVNTGRRGRKTFFDKRIAIANGTRQTTSSRFELLSRANWKQREGVIAAFQPMDIELITVTELGRMLKRHPRKLDSEIVSVKE